MSTHDHRPHPDGEFSAILHGLYRELDAEIARHAPVCVVSGRCCRFEEYGHTLFLSAPELALLLAEAPPPSRPLDEGRTCPWQDRQGRCNARDARPLGCRVYFCDPAFQDVAPGISETYIRRLKDRVATVGLAWDYAPLHHHLRAAVDDGRWTPLSV